MFQAGDVPAARTQGDLVVVRVREQFQGHFLGIGVVRVGVHQHRPDLGVFERADPQQSAHRALAEVDLVVRQHAAGAARDDVQAGRRGGGGDRLEGTEQPAGAPQGLHGRLPALGAAAHQHHPARGFEGGGQPSGESVAERAERGVVERAVPDHRAGVAGP